MLFGEYQNTLDDKGRIQIPSKLRAILPKDCLVVTQGLDDCLMLFTADEWRVLNEKIVASSSLFSDRKRLVMRRFVAPAQRLDFDKSGRISIPQTLREYAGLKGSCTILGINKYMELWDTVRYREYLKTTEGSFREAAETMSDILM